jgi:AcrR family transcriptional regulator
MTDAQRRRVCILEAADRLLRHYGPQKTTVADVAREAGVGVGSVYLEFPSKDVLVEEISRSRYQAVLAGMRAAAALDGARPAGSPASDRLIGALDARLEALLSLAAEGAHAGDLVHCVSPAVKAAQAAFHEEELRLVAELLRQGAASGELDVEDVDVAARTVLRAYATFTAPFLGGKDPDEVRRALAAMHRLVLHGLRRRGAGPAKAAKARR